MSYDRTKSRHECAVAGCGQLIPSNLLMCAPHWRKVPVLVQRTVYATWRNGGAEEYLAARKAAIDSVATGSPS